MLLILQGFNEAYTGSWVMLEAGCADGGHFLHVEGKPLADPRIVSLFR